MASPMAAASASVRVPSITSLTTRSVSRIMSALASTSPCQLSRSASVMATMASVKEASRRLWKPG